MHHSRMCEVAILAHFGLRCRLGSMPVAAVVLKAAHEQGHPPGKNEEFTVLPERDALSLKRVWLPALAAVGLEGIHLHDLRHTGNQLTANAGANLKELMARMGHDSVGEVLDGLVPSHGRRFQAGPPASSSDQVQA